MTMTTDRSTPGRVYVSNEKRQVGVLIRSHFWSGRLGPDGAPVADGEGVNVSAFGTLRASELRDLARLLIEEADALDGCRCSTVEGASSCPVHDLGDPDDLGYDDEPDNREERLYEGRSR